MLQFTARVEIRGVNPYVLVSKGQVTLLKPGWRKSLPVLVQINGKPIPPWKINMVPVGNGDFYLYLHGDVRKASNTYVGDTVEVSIEFDKEYVNGPVHPLPQWFANALAKNPIAKTNWEKLSPSRKKEILRYFALLKSTEARERNLSRVLDVLSEKPGRFMGRSWEKGK